MDAVDRDGGDAALRLLRRAGLRLTPQRVAIVRALLSESHPTAAEVYEAVRRRFPALGLATVYATLNTLVALGQIHELPFADAARYDANTAPHVNLVCTRCGQITDFVDCGDVLTLLSARAADLALFQLQDARVDLYGLCGSCRDESRIQQGTAVTARPAN